MLSFLIELNSPELFFHCCILAEAVAALQLETMQAFSIGASFATMLLNLTQWKKGGIAKGMR